MGLLSNYCGLGGSGKAQHFIDSLCEKHDAQYGELQDKGHNPYNHWNDADQEFLDALHDYSYKDASVKEIFIKIIAENYFQQKKNLLSLMGIESLSNLPDSEEDYSDSEEEEMAITMRRGHKRHQPHHANSDPIEHEGNIGTEVNTQQGAPVEGGEEQVNKIGHIWRRFPNEQTAALKWVMTVFGNNVTNYTTNKTPFDAASRTTTTALNTTGGGAWSNTANNTLLTTQYSNGIDLAIPQLTQLRMTSPYNIIKKIQGNDIASSFPSSQPNWLAYFDSMYQYYHCLETEWSIDIYLGTPLASTNVNCNNFQNYGVYIFWKYTSQDDPPTSWQIKGGVSKYGIAHSTTTTNQAAGQPDSMTTTALTASADDTIRCTPDDYFRMGGWHHKHVQINTTHPTRIPIKGKYNYGQCKMDIKTLLPTDAAGAQSIPTAEGWQLTGATPAFPELLSIILVQDNATVDANQNVKVPISMRFETEQLIQFRDLKANYKFPTPAISNNFELTTMATNEAFFWRGAAYT